MKTIKLPLILAILSLAPQAPLAATRCQVMEYPDHNEAVCIGDQQAVALPAAVPLQPSPSTAAGPAIPQQTAPPAPEDKAASPLPTAKAASPQTAKTESLRSLLDFKQHRLQRAELETKKGIRMKVIQAEQQEQPAPE